MCVYVRMNVCMCVCMFTCVYPYLSTQSHLYARLYTVTPRDFDVVCLFVYLSFYLLTYMLTYLLIIIIIIISLKWRGSHVKL